MSEIPTFKFALMEDLDLTTDQMFLPTKAEPQATGWDVRACWNNRDDHTIQPGEYIMIPLGFRMIAPEGWWVECRPRSSTFIKKHLHALYGVIDESFEGQCMFLAHLPKNEQALTIGFGAAVAQFIPVKRQEMVVEQVSNQEYERLIKERNFSRGAGGFGSTGK